jgi:sec-independent protein translocase protein TatA
MELVLVLVIALIVLGPKRLPEAGKALGKGLREFKDSVSGIAGDDDDDGEPVAPPAPAAKKLPADADSTAAPH